MSPEAIEIRDAAFARLQPFVAPEGKPFRWIGKVPKEKEPDEELPSLQIVALREQSTPDGDLNAGEPCFVTDLTLACLIVVSGNDRDKADARLSSRIALVQSTLLRDPSFVTLFEGVAGMAATRTFDMDGERFFARGRVDITVQYRTDFPPIVPDDFESVVANVHPVGSGPDTPPITVKIDVPAN